MMANIFRKKIGLALGGGGARGVSHIGVLKVLDEARIPIHLIAGTSIGALVGGAYASGLSPEEIAEKMETFVASREFQSSALRSLESAFAEEQTTLMGKIQSFVKNQLCLIQMLFRPSLLSADHLESLITYFIPEIDIADCRVAFRAVATDITTGEPFVFSSGSLRKAVLASSAVPGAVEPIPHEEKLLADGGIVAPVPVRVAKAEGVDMVIAVPVDRSLPIHDEFKTARDVLYQASEITTRIVEKYELAQADVIITPNAHNLHWSHFSRACDLIQEGEKAARASLPLIKAKRFVFSKITQAWKSFHR